MTDAMPSDSETAPQARSHDAGSSADTSEGSEVADGDDGSRQAVGALPPRRRRRPGLVWILPAVVGVLWLLFTALGIHGSSIAQLSSDPARASGLIAGDSRSIRSDEWNVRAPLISGQVHRGFDRYIDNGVGVHDMALQNDIPTSDWSVALRPHLWGYFVLPLANGMAWDWWGCAAVLILGTYALLMVMVKDWRWATAGALVLYASPFFHWWYIPAPVAMVGYAAAAAACLVMSLRRQRPLFRWGWVAATAFLLGAFGVHMYPPFQIPTVLVFAVVFVGHVIDEARAQAVSWRRAVVNSLVAGAGAGFVLGVFVLTRIETLKALAETVYPGQRRIDGGAGFVGHLSSGWYSWVFWKEPTALRGTIFGNESEASSFLLLGVFLLAALPFVWKLVAGSRSRHRFQIVAVVGVLVVLLVHMYVGLPAIVGKILALDRVQEVRAIIGLGIGSVMLLVLVGVGLEQATVARWRRIAGGLVLAGVSGGYVLTLGQQLRDAGAGIGMTSVALSVLAAVVVAGLYFWRPLVGMCALVVVGLVLSVPVNPLFRGAAPLEPQDLVASIEADRSQTAAQSWLTDMRDLSTILQANGIDDVSGINLYPNVDAWRKLDPNGTYENVWNRFSNTFWEFDPSLDGVQMTVRQGDAITVRIDPCVAGLDALDVGHIVSASPIEAECLVPDGTITTPKGRTGYVYLREPVGG